ncbi:MAG: carbon-nitrogen hydrolase [Thermoguttaceae bacterium]|nr:carbon-nitrogen hydrolase [Thermoguttaceae bacterium]MDW8078005.1 carbon-nitrogen hydrolase [Thermoguttaceae bacterium]
MSQISIGLVQLKCTAKKEENLTAAAEMIREAVARGAQIVCLPELFATPYPCQSEDHRQFDLAEPLDGPTVQLLCQLSGELGIAAVGSIFERRDAGLYHNTAVVCEGGKLLGFYRKTHIPDDPCYYEKFYFTPGDVGYPVFQVMGTHIAVGVCWDQWFPEVARLFALGGAKILFYPTAIGWLVHEKAEFGQIQQSAWETMHRSHAIANGFYVAAVNRVGLEGNIEFWGASLLCDPNGVVLCRASVDRPEVLVVVCDLNKVDVVRTHWPFLRDRRIDTYQGLLQRYLRP